MSVVQVPYCKTLFDTKDRFENFVLKGSQMAVTLTGDRTTVSNFRHNLFVGGFMSGFPKLPWTTLFYKYLNPWCRTDKEGIFREAPLGLRKVESCLVHHEIDCKVVHPKYLERYIQQGDTLCVSCVDPLGTGPVPSMINKFVMDVSLHKTIEKFFGIRENFLKLEFDRLINRIGKLREKREFDVVVGGPGAEYLMDKMDDCNIDHIYLGEVEIGLPKFVKDGSSKKVIRGELPEAEDIHPIVNPTDGRVELSRGCGRGCKFCGPALKGRMRYMPIEKIIEEVRVNQQEGHSIVTLQSEDFLLYGADRFVPQTDAVMDVFKSIFNETDTHAIFPMHVSFSSILANPDLIEELSDFLRSRGQKVLASQPGMETGSTKLIKDLMPGKLLPFKDMEWKEVVLDSIKILKRNGWYFVATLITGLPGETEEDIEDTIDLVESIDHDGGLIIPLFFSPVKYTNLEDKRSFFDRSLKEQHLKLIKTCWKRNVKRIPKIYKSAIGEASRNRSVSGLFATFGMRTLTTLSNGVI